MTTLTDQYSQLLLQVKTFYKTKPSWGSFHRTIFGLEGIIRKTFPVVADRLKFEESDAFVRIQDYLAKLRKQDDTTDKDDTTAVITVRMPRDVHMLLKEEAHENRTSLNQLAVDRLLRISK